MPDMRLKHLAPGVVIPNWTAAKGYLGDSFTIGSISSTRIEVHTPGAEHPQNVPIRDFKAVADLWMPYCDGSIQRQRIRNLTRYSKYIISILKYLSEKDHNQ